MDDYFSDWSSTQFEPYYLRCIIDEQAIEGKGEYEKFYDDYTNDSGVYRFSCGSPFENNGVKHFVIYMGQSGGQFGWNGLGFRTTCYINFEPKNGRDERVRNRIRTLVREKTHGQIILECLLTENCEKIEAMLLSNYEKIHDSLPVENIQGENPYNFDVKDPNCKLLHLVEDNWIKDS